MIRRTLLAAAAALPFAFSAIAAKAGDEEAAGYMPGLLLDGPPFEAPLDSLPEGWVTQAFTRADAWIDCYGPPRVE